MVMTRDNRITNRLVRQGKLPASQAEIYPQKTLQKAMPLPQKTAPKAMPKKSGSVAPMMIQPKPLQSKPSVMPKQLTPRKVKMPTLGTSYDDQYGRKVNARFQDVGAGSVAPMPIKTTPLQSKPSVMPKPLTPRQQMRQGL